MPNYDENGIHGESRDTYNYIANWANTTFPFSKTDDWYRFGLLGILGHLFLTSLVDAHIIEIGTGESSIYLTEVARRLNRRIFYCDYAYGKIYNPYTVKGYLHENTIILRENTEHVNYTNYNGVAYQGTSDNFFKDLMFPNIGLAFIDGEHRYDTVKRDFDNIFQLLVPNGVIFLHDTYPPNESYVKNDYCADAYRMRQELEQRDDIDVFTFTKTVGVDVGITMCRKKPINRPYYQQ